MGIIVDYEEFANAYPADSKGVHHVVGDWQSLVSGTITLPRGHSLSVAPSRISGGFTRGYARELGTRARGRW